MATSSEIEQVRRRIGDSVKSNTEIQVGDGSTVLFDLKFKNVWNAIVKVGGTATTAFTLNGKSGQIIFQTAPALEASIEITYDYAGYTDDDLSEMIGTYGVSGSVVECLNELLVDSARFFDYSQGQTTDKRSQIFDHLKTLLAKAENDAGLSGGEVVFGKRHPEGRCGRPIGIDLSRSDKWSDNNV